MIACILSAYVAGWAASVSFCWHTDTTIAPRAPVTWATYVIAMVVALGWPLALILQHPRIWKRIRRGVA